MGEEMGEASIVEEGEDSEVLAPPAEGRQIYDLESVFPQRKGFRARRRNKSKLRLIERVHALLFQMLSPDERVLFLSRATLNIQWWEVLFIGGLAAGHYNRRLLALTNLRFIVIEASWKGKPKYYRHQIELGNIIRFKISKFLSQTLTLYMADGKKRIFRGIAPRELSHLRDLLGKLSIEERLPTAKKHCYQSLCYSCHKPMPQGLYVCPNCQTEYRTPKKAVIRSLILPGWGDLYLKRTFYGSLEAAGHLFLVVIFVTSIVDAVANPETAEVGAVALILIAMVIYRLIDGLVTRAMARKGLVPVKA